VVTVTVTAQDGTVAYVLNNAPNDGRQTFTWDGIGNQGAFNNVPITLAAGPYTIRVAAQTAGLTADRTVYVLCRDIVLLIGSYTEDGNPPDPNTRAARYVQYRLNELGYFAGPVDGNIAIGTQSRRALARYCHDHPDVEESRAERSADYGTRADVINALQNDICADHIRIEGNALPASGASAKIYLDHNYHYVNGPDFSRDDGHCQRDAAKLNRVELPIEARIRLLGRGDADGSQDGIAAPAAVGAVKVQWTVTHPAETVARYPTAMQRPSARMSTYLAQNPADGNCLVALGGSLPTANPNAAHFVAGNVLPPYTTVINADDVFTTAYTGATAARVGKAGVIFRGSYIAGDRYKVKATVSFDGMANSVQLTQAHAATLGAQWTDKACGKTGTMTVWRRHRLSTVINWPAPTGRAVNWADVAAEYAFAYCELDTAAMQTITGANFLTTYAAALAANTVETRLANDFNDGVPFTMNGNALFPITIPAQGTFTTAKEYKAQIESDLSDRLTVGTLQKFAEALEVNLHDHHRAGTILVHGKWVPTITVYHKPLKGLGKATDPHGYDPKVFCIGLGCGVTIIANSMYPQYHDRFVIAHEMGHNRWLRHHVSGKDEMGATQRGNLHLAAWNRATNPCANPRDHDTLDTTCTMSYPFALNPQPDWSPTGNDQSAFCGKCLLKLRGWNVVEAALPTRS
jgi:hypothetical protein